MLKYGLDYIFENFSSNFNSTGINFLKKFSKDEKNIDYNNLFFEIDHPAIKSYNFLKHFSTLYDLLINLLIENETILDSLTIPLDLAKIIYSLKSVISKKIESITEETEEQKKKILLHKIAF